MHTAARQGMGGLSLTRPPSRPCSDLEFTPETTFIYRDTMPLLGTVATPLPADRQTWYTLQVWHKGMNE
jgi:hypothetical protein